MSTVFRFEDNGRSPQRRQEEIAANNSPTVSHCRNERTNDDRIVFSLEDSGGFPPEEEKSEFQLKTEENCKLQTAQGMLHCYMKPGGRSWLEKVPVAEETTNQFCPRVPKDVLAFLI